MLGPARAPSILVGARSWDLTPWSGNHRSLPARVDFSLGLAQVLPILIGARSWDLTLWSGNHRSLSAKADPGRCSVI
ncbi:hypothetical protein TIFTF001_038068 [Ficus carica]|uniref:Uncharacterized protein n=1 Tax=Ficus carica TaxID=3494 RepID=A0AA88EAW3_FICCA|nr:hypothetical protein TIFTF001_038068 [Ficus carica]